MNKDYQRIEKAITYLQQNYPAQPGLEELSDAIHLSPYHLQRLFKRWAGVTPKQFLQCVTVKHTNEFLHDGMTMLETSQAAGLSSSSRLHDLYINVHAMSPAQYRNKGQGMVIKYGYHPTPFGPVLVGMTDKGICTMHFSPGLDKAEDSLKQHWNNAEHVHDQNATAEVVEMLFSDARPARKVLQLHLGGTNFQLKVWQALLEIPFGQVTNYGNIAATIGMPGASRAVGSAIGNNPVAYIIPCHRVIRASGVIGNYHWGEDRKKAILTWEQCQLASISACGQIRI